ncbi:MAG: 1-deoxy-D-xylulose-5-phosphate synthase [Rikenellaceae bacterium]
MEYKILNSINSPDDLKLLTHKELVDYAGELRHYIIEQCAVNPGHVASGLGVVELTVALHYVYNTPFDKLVWDVGHQTYPHKIITERREAFCTKRQQGGISGFPRMSESQYDSFGAGHSSVSISAAFGMAKAAELLGAERKVVAVIGDGSMTGGLAFEGLNNAGASENTDLLVILNDNDMAIDQATGALKGYLLRIATSRKYNRFKQWLWQILSHVPPLLRMLQIAGSAVKQGILRNSNLFESLNFRYFGPVDGHDIEKLIRVLRSMRSIEGPKLLHVRTVKGKGFSPAESDMRSWHAPGQYNPETGERIHSAQSFDRYQDVFGHTLVELAKEDKRIIGVTPAMLSGSSMDLLQEALPERCFDVGIAEGHAVTYSAGAAAAGLIPFCNIYSTFVQRAYDNIIHDVAIQNLHVVICLDRGGLVGEDGATHHGFFDMTSLSSIPNLVVAAPADELELRNLMYTAYCAEKPFVIRYPRGTGQGAQWRGERFEQLPLGVGRKLKDGDRVAVLSIGTTAALAREAIEMCGAKEAVAHYDMRFVKPLDEAILREVAESYDAVITIEDGVVAGGAGERIGAYFAKNNHSLKIENLGIPDRFVEHATQRQLYAECGYDPKSISSAIARMLLK